MMPINGRSLISVDLIIMESRLIVQCTYANFECGAVKAGCGVAKWLACQSGLIWVPGSNLGAAS
jgi:hypothetical protein